MAAIAVLLALAGCSAEDDRALQTTAGHPGHPNVLLITVDTQRADHCHVYGYPRETTPHLDELAAAGALFAHAYTPIPTTGPSHASLFTSTYPRVHGVLKNGYVLADTNVTLAEVLQDGGYHTGAVVSAFPLAARFGYGQGYASYDDRFTPREASILLDHWEGHRLDDPSYDRRANATTTRALDWLATVPTATPFFLWVHYYDPHEPYDPPDHHDTRYQSPRGAAPMWLRRAVDAYDAEIHFADAEIGRLIEAHDELVDPQDTLVVLATDHGEGFMQHGVMAHGDNLYEELVRTVLVFRWPGNISPGQRLRGLAGLIDVAPTVVGLAGVDPGDSTFLGMDLSAALLDGAPLPEDRPLYFQRRVYESGEDHDLSDAGPMWAVRVGRWKYIEAPGQGVRELFDIAVDPGETQNVHDDRATTASALAARLHAWRGGTNGGREPSRQTVSPEDAMRLRALGYHD